MAISRKASAVACMVLFSVLVTKVWPGRQSQFFNLADSFVPNMVRRMICCSLDLSFFRIVTGIISHN